MCRMCDFTGWEGMGGAQRRERVGLWPWGSLRPAWEAIWRGGLSLDTQFVFISLLQAVGVGGVWPLVGGKTFGGPAACNDLTCRCKSTGLVDLQAIKKKKLKKNCTFHSCSLKWM